VTNFLEAFKVLSNQRLNLKKNGEEGMMKSMRGEMFLIELTMTMNMFTFSY